VSSEETADQDSHKKNWGDATDARTAILAPSLTKAALLSAMRHRHVYATEDRNLRLIYRVNNQLLGSRITGAAVPAPGTALNISLAITDDRPNSGLHGRSLFATRSGAPLNAINKERNDC
jgi:hypothetical protein